MAEWPENHLSTYARTLQDELHGPQVRFVAFYHAYKNLVLDYTSPSLTNPKDALNAFTATVSALSRLSRSKFVVGMAEYCLDLALLWVADCSPNTAAKAAGVAGKFPSWPWVGCSGSVDFLLRWSSLNMLNASRSEIGQTTVEEGGRLHAVLRSPVLQSPIAEQLPIPPPMEPLYAPSATAVLHLWAQVACLEDFKATGGKLVCTHGRFAIDNQHLENMPSQNFQYFFGDFGPTANFELRQNMQWEYYNYLATDTAGDVDLGLALLSRLKRLPSRHIRPLDDDPRNRVPGEWGMGEDHWVTMNAMLVWWREDGVGERVAVGHVHEDEWLRANPRWRYIKVV